MSEFKTIETQEQLDAIIGERISRAEKKAAEKYADYDDLKKQVDELNTQISGLTEQIKAKDEAIAGNDETVNALKAKVQDYETRSVKMRIAHEVGLPYQLADTLTGDNEDAIREDAKNLAQFVAKPAAPLGGAEPEDTSSDPVKASLADLARQIGN